MSAVTRQARANLRSGRLQTGLVTVTVVAASALLTVALASLGAAGDAYERLHERLDGAHLMLDLAPDHVDPDVVLATLGDLPGVVATTELRPTAFSRLRFGSDHQYLQVRDWPGDHVPVGRTLVVDGRAPAAGAHTELTIDRNLAAHHEVEVGDVVELLTPAGWAPVQVAGLTVTAELCPPPMCDPSIAHTGQGGLAALGLLSTGQPETQTLAVGLRLADPGDHAAALRAIEAALPRGAVVSALTHEWVADISDRIERLASVFLAAFGLVAAVAAGVLIANAIGQSVQAQTRQIGLLKAVGFTRAQVARTFLVEYLGVALGASLVGVLAGAAIAAWLLAGVAGRFGAAAGVVPGWVVAGVPALVVTIAAVLTILPTRRATRIDVVTAVRTGRSEPRRRATRLSPLPTPIATALVDLRAAPARSLLTAGGLALAAMTLVFAATVQTTLASLAEDPRGGLVTDADLVLERPETMSDQALRDLLAAQPEVVGVRTERWVSWSLPGEGARHGAFSLDGDLTRFTEPLLDGRAPREAGEAMVGYGLASEHGLSTGDVLAIEVAGQPVDLFVTGVYRQLHVGLQLHADTLVPLGLDGQPGRYQLELVTGADPQEVAAALAAASGGLVAAEPATSFVAPILATLPAVMLALVLVLSGIALLGVLNTVWMGVQERTRELGLMKAVGMSGAQTVASVLLAASALAGLGYLAGLLAGIAGTRALLDQLGRGLGFGPIPTHADAALLAAVLPVLVLVAVLGALLPARRAARLPVAATLRVD
jgi:putative ABC transport system permease protein